MEYADSLSQVLVRKINKAERDLVQLKLDYCRFVFGISHRARVRCDGRIFLVRSVDVDTMHRREDGHFEKPELSGVPLSGDGSWRESELVPLGVEWEVVPESESHTGGR